MSDDRSHIFPSPLPSLWNIEREEYQRHHSSDANYFLQLVASVAPTDTGLSVCYKLRPVVEFLPSFLVLFLILLWLHEVSMYSVLKVIYPVDSNHWSETELYSLID